MPMDQARTKSGKSSRTPTAPDRTDRPTAGNTLDLFAGPRRLIENVRSWLGDAEGRRHRRVSVVGDRAYIEVRGTQGDRHQAIRTALRTQLERFAAVDWAEVDAATGRLVLAFDPDSVEIDDLVDAVADIEHAHGVAEETFPHSRPDHPSDDAPIKRHLFALGADAVGLGVAAIGQATRISGIPAEIPGVISLIEYQPRTRRFLENRLGNPATDALLATTNATAQALSQGPVGLLADMGYRASLIIEQRARQAVWDRLDNDLIEGPRSLRPDPVHVPDRPVPLPRGPIENYTRMAAPASLGALGLTFAATGDPRRAANALLLGVPKAANRSREVFAALADRSLANSDIIVMDKAVLRRFDRVNTLALDARTVSSGRWTMDRIELVHPDADETVCRSRVRRLLVADDPSAERTQGSWHLRPHRRDERAPRGSQAASRRVGHGGRRRLDLWRGDRLMAVVGVTEEPTPLAVELVAEARRAELEVHLVGGTEALSEHLGDIPRWTATNVTEEIRTAQEAGQVVMFLSGRAHRGLRAADVGLAVSEPERRVPSGAHVIIRELGQVWMLLEAVTQARAASRRAALLAAGGAGAGAVWSMLGPSRAAAARTMMAVNISTLLGMAGGAMMGTLIGNTRPPLPPPVEPWHEMTGDDAMLRTGSSERGLDEAERATRLENDTARVKPSPVGLGKAMIAEIVNPLTPLLGVGAALSAAVGSLTDAGLVAGVVGVNALVGAVQQVQTDRALHELHDAERPTVDVLVDGEARTVTADEVVVGDIVVLEAGDEVPADCRIIAAEALEVDESTLTGESLPIAKQQTATPGAPVPERTSMLYEGTVVAAGEVTALVVAVGRDTEAGRSAEAAAAPPPTGVEQRLEKITRTTIPVTIGAGVIATGLGALFRRPIRESVGTGVSLMVAAVPEGLPALATLSQVAAARRLAKRNALVRNPRSIEALGRADQICFDKTGTLTEGVVSLRCVTDGVDERSVDDLGATGLGILELARRATPLPNGNGPLPHATDRAVYEAATPHELTDTANGFERIVELPFESRRGFHAVLGRFGDEIQLVVKGAPEVLAERCTTWERDGVAVPIDPEARRTIEDHVEHLARRGLRVLAVATGPVAPGTTGIDDDAIDGLTLVGFLGLADRVRSSAREAVDTLTRAGVNLAMITGDHPSTAEAIAAELGMLNGHRVFTGAELESLDDDELDAAIGEVRVFARVTPLQKVRIVASYQRIGRSVAMTGDGANDAAAIRLADAGIALGGRGTDAARANADLVVLDDRLETIVEAVVEGRAMWESLRKAVAILVGGNLGEIGFILAGTAFGGTSPLNARQLLLVNLLTDMAPALAIALRTPTDVSPEALLHAGPDASLGTSLTRNIAVRAGATALGATGAYAAARFTGTPTRARTVGLVALVGTQLGQTVIAGGPNPLVLGATALSTAALVGMVQTPGVSQFFGCRPLGPLGWATAAGSSAVATGLSVVVPDLAERAARRIAEIRSDDHTHQAKIIDLFPGAAP